MEESFWKWTKGSGKGGEGKLRKEDKGIVTSQYDTYIPSTPN